MLFSTLIITTYKYKKFYPFIHIYQIPKSGLTSTPENDWEEKEGKILKKFQILNK